VKIVSSFTHTHVASNMYDVIIPWNTEAEFIQ